MEKYKKETCPTCGGRGKALTAVLYSFGSHTSYLPCDRCSGSGIISVPTDEYQKEIQNAIIDYIIIRREQIYEHLKPKLLMR